MKFTYVSPDGEQGFPGTLVTNIIYTVTETNGLIVSYHAVSDKKTLINLTNHNYFNLGGHESGTIENTKVRIYADEFTPINEDTIPTGENRLKNNKKKKKKHNRRYQNSRTYTDGFP